MATLNLGRIKPVFQGAYNNSTAYVVDDIVTFGDETFICIQASTGNATSNASYWTKLAAKGTDGTDVGTTLTTQGDILYRDGSGLQRLGAGTNGQALLTGGAGANPSWGTVSGASNAFFAYDKSNNTSGDVVWTTELYDDGGNYDTSNGRYTAPSAGKYLFSVQIYTAQSAGNDMYFKLNGSTFAGGTDGFTYGYNTQFPSSTTVVLDLSASDYISFYTQNNTYSNYTYFTGVKLY